VVAVIENLVLGAGLSALGFADNFEDCRLFEKKNHYGGHAYSHKLRDRFFDEGAHISHSKDPEFIDRFINNNVCINHIQKSIVKNYYQGAWFGYPIQNNLFELPEIREEALIGIIRAQIENKNTIPQNYLDWCLSQYGKFITDNFYKVFTSKYWRTPMDELATDWLAKRLVPSQVERIIKGTFHKVEEKQTVFSSCRYPKNNGFYSLYKESYSKHQNIQLNSEAVKINLKKGIVRFNTGEEQKYKRLISTIPLPKLISIAEDVPEKLFNEAKKLRYTKMLCVNVILSCEIELPYHWAYIYDPNIDASRISFPDRLSGRTENKCFQAEIFRRNDEAMNVDELLNKTIHNLSNLLGYNPKTDIVDCEAVFVEYAYVISDIHRSKIVDSLHQYLHELNVYPTGLYGNWKYVFSDVAYKQGERLAKEISEIK